MGVVCLHGFSGSPASWNAVMARLPADLRVSCPALAGHDRGSLASAGFVAEVDRLAGLLASDAPHHLAGYSLGGRLALGLLVRHAGLFSSATLIGAHPGLGDDDRRRRRAADEKLSRMLEQEGIERFVDYWQDLPLFRSQHSLPPETLRAQRATRLGHSAAGLARALRALGLGGMPDYGPSLAKIEQPVHLMAGADDAKFRRLAESTARALPRATLEIVPAAGHNLILEAPDAVASAIERGLPRAGEH